MTLADLVPWTRERVAHPRSPGAREGSPFLALHREMNRLFDETLRGFDAASVGGLAPAGDGFVPRLDVAENDAEIRVALELPGLDQKDVDVSLTGDLLVVRGEKRDRRETAGSKDERWHRVESRYGAFERALQLPCEVERDATSARFEHGVLTIVLPKAPSARPQVRRIDIQS